MKNLLESGVHFGHQTRHWNPKMKQYIFTARNGIHIINLQKTIMLAKEAYEALREVAAKGGQILFVGTKKQAQLEVEKAAKACGMPFINKRWLGGLLTNFQTVKRSILHFRKLEEAFRDDSIHQMVKTKKETLYLKREVKRMQKDLSGIKDMDELPEALFVVDSRREAIAVREAVRLGIPVFALVDTNSDPTFVDYPIPANDDAIRAIALFLDIMVSAITEGKSGEKSTSIEIEDSEEPQEEISEEEQYKMSKLYDLEEIEKKYGTDDEYDPDYSED